MTAWGCRSRTRTVAALAAMVLLGGLLSDAAAESKAPPTLRVALGGSVFWDTDWPEVETDLPDCERGRCVEFHLDVARGGRRLRVAMDTDGTTRPGIEVFDAAGDEVATGGGVYSAEVYVPNPTPGRYVVRFSGTRGASRFRARLDRTVPTPPRDGRPLLPNLRLVPPYEFTMDPAAAAGFDLLGCNAYEKAEYGARRCLRFSLGPANVGDGPFMLEFPAMSGLAAAEPVYQLVAHADGRVSRRQAGTALYHKTHAHHHHNGFGSLELFKVLDPRRGRMVPAGNGPKQGFCMLDFLIADWRSFGNDEANSIRQDCSLASGPTSTQLGLGRGWADIYTYGLDGNYVEFGENSDGRYVVRSVADASNDVLETDESDNAGYAYIEVEGSTVTVLERGQGLSPWDPRKRLADDILPSNA